MSRFIAGSLVAFVSVLPLGAQGAKGFFTASSGARQISRPTGVNVLDPAY